MIKQKLSLFRHNQNKAIDAVSILQLMDPYYKQVKEELARWQVDMQAKPSATNRLTKSLQERINNLIPDKIHQAVTAAIKQMTRGVILGAEVSTTAKIQDMDLQQTENKIRERIKFYRSTAAVEGGLTGAGGFLWGLADFPLWLSLKMKMLFEIASYYGMDLKDYKERVYILHVFQLTFSSQSHRRKIYKVMSNWEEEKKQLPDDINQFDWRTFQLEYRDYIDLAKFFQMIPGVGAAVGAFVNHRLTNKLGQFAMNAYRLRRL